jgi:hypothetical protein
MCCGSAMHWAGRLEARAAELRCAEGRGGADLCAAGSLKPPAGVRCARALEILAAHRAPASLAESQVLLARLRRRLQARGQRGSRSSKPRSA